ncbi:hypothetical protein [Streptomyces sp. NPDC004291]
MSTDASHPGRRELRVTVTDGVYEQLQALAADSRVPAEEYAARMLTDDVTRARFLAGADGTAVLADDVRCGLHLTNADDVSIY